MTYKEIANQIFLTLDLPIDGDTEELFFKYIYESTAEIANILGLCKSCLELNVSIGDCEIELPENVLDVVHSQVTIAGFDLQPTNSNKIQALKTGYRNPSVYAWDSAKPTKLLFAPSAKCDGMAFVDIVEKVDPTTFDCDDEFLDGKANHLITVVMARASVRAAIQCNEQEKAGVLLQEYQEMLNNIIGLYRNPSVVERLKALSRVELDDRQVLDSYT